MEQPFTIGEYNHFQLHVRDLERLIAFYPMFGPVEEVAGRNTPVSLGPATQLFLHHGPNYEPASHGNLDCFALVLEGSPDIQEVVDHMRAHGAEPFDGPENDGRGYIRFFVRDPHGNQSDRDAYQANGGRMTGGRGRMAPCTNDDLKGQFLVGEGTWVNVRRDVPYAICKTDFHRWQGGCRTSE